MVLNPVTFIRSSENGTLIDARSESEFLAGHIPGAISLPILTDHERHLVGTTYKVKGPEQAVIEGAELVGPRLGELLKEAKDVIKRSPVYIYCWRGGKRSESLAWILKLAGYETHTMQGGYKAYRSLLPQWCERELNLAILGGHTGSAKTEVLHSLKAMGEQVVDLEDLAKHKGSAFGNLEAAAQPTTEQMANNLFKEVDQMDPSKTIWVEDESRTIGTVYLPEPFFETMKSAPLYIIQRSKKERIDHLVNAYGNYPAQELELGFERIGKRLGGQHVKRAVECIQQGDLAEAVEIALSYYDKKYQHGMHKNDHRTQEVDGKDLTPKQLAIKLLECHNAK